MESRRAFLVVSHIFYVHPPPPTWRNDPILRAYFSTGLKAPTSFELEGNLKAYKLGKVRTNVVRRASTDAIRKAVAVRSHTTFALIPTDR